MRRAATAGLLVTLLAAGCGGGSDDSEPKIDNVRLQRELTPYLARTTGTVVDRVACPAVVGRPGLTIECNAGFNNEADVILVTLTAADPRGGRWRARLKYLLIGRVETVIGRELARRRFPVASVSCPRTQVQRAGHSFVCDVETRAGGRRRIRVTETDDRGNVRLAPAP